MSASRSSESGREEHGSRRRRARSAARAPPRIERSAGGVVFRVAQEELRVLLIRDPYGKWGLPKGHIESGEEETEAALREVREETGLEHLLLGPAVSTIDWYFRTRNELIHKFCTFYLMHSPRGEAAPELDEGITQCVWVPLEEAVETVEYANTRGVVRSAGRMINEGEWEGPFEL